MIIISFGLFAIKAKRALLFGEMRQYPVISIHFLFVSIAFIRGNPVGVFREAIMGLTEDREWLVKNSRALRIAKAKARAKATAKMEAQYRGELTRAREMWSRFSHHNGDLQNEVYALRRVIKGMNKQESEQP